MQSGAPYLISVTHEGKTKCQVAVNNSNHLFMRNDIKLMVMGRIR